MKEPNEAINHAEWHGYKAGREYQMSNPNEPKFEDDFFNEPSDDEPYEQETTTLYDIASTKAWNYTLEYDKTTGMVSPKHNSAELKEAYKAGFLEGFAYRLTQPTPDTGE